ncbi:MAG: hypothetical protein IPP35_00685 [Elusimicrobia bacterium]|nr:hypothetical protein [Elusimicrobiota bacterium]
MAVFSVVLFGGGLDCFYESVSFIAAARARGDTAILFLRGPALRAFVESRWSLDEALPSPESFHFQNKTPRRS